jgi:uncharacterized protein
VPYDPPPEIASLSLAEIAEWVAAQKLPPVAQWSPAKTGDSEMRIAADGRWYHQGGLISRPAMVRAFASLLMCDDAGQHWLVTPHERLAITVEDAAFVAVDVTAQDGVLVFRINSDELVIAGAEHPVTARGDADVPALYLAVRHGCEARLNRSTYGQLIDIALENGGLHVSSMGVDFSLVPA